MSPIKPRGGVKPTPPKVPEDPDQTIAEPPRDFTDEIFQQLTGGTAELAPLQRDQGTLPMPQRPAAGSAPPAFAPPPPAFAPPRIGAAPPSAPQVYVPAPQSAPAPMSAPLMQQPEVRVRTPLWALIYLGFALLAIAFGLFVLFMQSRVAGHF